jgi:GMP synthase (glutamine-hydrolysing)
MDTIAVIDFGGQYTHLIANRIRRLGVYSEIVESTVSPSRIGEFAGGILSGGPSSVLDPQRPPFDPAILHTGIPFLGLCYGHQLITYLLGGTVRGATTREYGLADLEIADRSELFNGIDSPQQVWMSHGDSVEKIPAGFEILARTADCPTAAIGSRQLRYYGLQFHPEVTDTPCGMKILDNFLDICGCMRTWNSDAYLREISGEVKKKCRGRKVFLLVSGGVDSTVAFTLLNNVLGAEHVIGLHIDTGLMRLGESEQIMSYLKSHGFDNLHIVNAEKKFIDALRGVSDPERKRQIIGELFVEVKMEAERKLNINADEYILGQGTIYPDTIESAGTKHADKIKTHHNRVDAVLLLMEKGLVIEPLSHLYKDEVRKLGEKLELPHTLVWRHPFPGPGLGVRLLCSDSDDGAVEQPIEDAVASIMDDTMYRSSVLPIRSVGVQGDGRSYGHPALLFGPQNWAALETLSTRITNTVAAVNRVVYALNVPSPRAYRRITAYVIKDRLDILRRIDDLVTRVLRKYDTYDTIWQMPVVMLPLVTPEGGECVVLRPIVSQEAMTARFVPLPDEVLGDICEGARGIDGIGDIFFDVTHKPPGTIEWE